MLCGPQASSWCNTSCSSYQFYFSFAAVEGLQQEAVIEDDRLQDQPPTSPREDQPPTSPRVDQPPTSPRVDQPPTSPRVDQPSHQHHRG